MRNTLRNAFIAVLFLFDPNATAANFTVNTTSDTVDVNPGNGSALDGSGFTSVRAAIMEANALSGDDIITLPAGTYEIEIAGTGENASATGDFDITSTVTINGADASTTIISGADLDRVFNVRSGASLTLNEVTVRDGMVTDFEWGAGIFVEKATLEVNDCIITSNSANGSGGGVLGFANPGLPSTITFRDSTISENSTQDSGGGIEVFAISPVEPGPTAAATLLIENCLITQNSAFGVGTGVSVSASGPNSTAELTITDSTIDANISTSTGVSQMGSGIYHAGGHGATANAEITRCTISNHDEPGGGIRNVGAEGLATMLISNSTISGNRTYDLFDDNAGGILNQAWTTVDSTATLTVRNSTITNNSLTEFLEGEHGGGAGGIQNYEFMGTATCILENTIVDGNHSLGANFDVSGEFVGDGNNLIGNDTGSTGFGGSDLIDVDALLGPLADNGGLTLTHAIPVNSPARNAGNNTGAPATDQRGQTRIFGGTVDIGAFEVQGINTVYADFAFTGIELGTQTNPFDTLADALTAAAEDATINIATGTTPETPEINQAVTLQSTGGIVRIGDSGSRNTFGQALQGFVSTN